MHAILQKLAGGDLRSKGRSEEVVEDILNNPDLFGVVFAGMLIDDPVVRMRSADAIEKVSAKHPELLQPYKRRLINEVARIEQKEVRWHVAQMFSCVDLTPTERNEVVSVLKSYLEDQSKIVKTFAMQALADLAFQEESIRPEIRELIQNLMSAGSPAMRTRGKRLIAKLDSPCR